MKLNFELNTYRLLPWKVNPSLNMKNSNYVLKTSIDYEDRWRSRDNDFLIQY